jgi:rubredoxin
VLIDIVLVLVALALLVALAISFGVDDEHVPSRCPSCGLEELRQLYKDRVRGGPLHVVCRQCGTEYRQQADGTLTAVAPGTPWT